MRHPEGGEVGSAMWTPAGREDSVYSVMGSPRIWGGIRLYSNMLTRVYDANTEVCKLFRNCVCRY